MQIRRTGLQHLTQSDRVSSWNNSIHSIGSRFFLPLPRIMFQLSVLSLYIGIFFPIYQVLVIKMKRINYRLVTFSLLLYRVSQKYGNIFFLEIREMILSNTFPLRANIRRVLLTSNKKP